MTWQQALDLMNVSSENVNPIANSNSLLVTIPGAPMAKIATGRDLGSGYQVDWLDNDPDEGNAPVLQVAYLKFDK